MIGQQRGPLFAGISTVKKQAIVVSSVSVVVLAVLAALCFNHVTRPMPGNITEPWRTRWVVGLLYSLDAMAQLAQFSGIASKTTIRRLASDHMSIVTRHLTSGNENVTDTTFDGVLVRVYSPDNRTGAGIVFYHGGGWSFGSIETHDYHCRLLAKKTGAVVVSVNYRLSPDFPYPVPLEDCLKATVHFFRTYADYQVDPGRIALMGDSAGGTLAAAVALRLRDSAIITPLQPKLQVLIYPNLQAIDFTIPSYNEDTVYGTPELLVEMLLMYMGKPAHCASQFITDSRRHYQLLSPIFASYKHLLKNTNQQDAGKGSGAIEDEFVAINRTSPMGDLRVGALTVDAACNDIVADSLSFITDGYCMPLMAASLQHLPEAYVVTVQSDVLRDDGILYAHRLRKDDVKVTHKHYERGYHGIWAFIYGPIWTEVGAECFDDTAQYLVEHL